MEQADLLADALIKDVSGTVRLWKLIRLLGVRRGFEYFRISRGLRQNPARAFSWATECEQQAETCEDTREAAALSAWAKKLRNLDY